MSSAKDISNIVSIDNWERENSDESHNSTFSYMTSPLDKMRGNFVVHKDHNG